jgi:predicted ATP-grasp superfamily ATP-dependent carboligase
LNPKQREVNSQSSSCPALVLGSDITALGTIRSLKRENIPVYYIPTKDDYVTYSRWAKKMDHTLPERPGAEALGALLSRLPFREAVLFPCSDNALTAASQIGEDLTNRFRPVVPSPGTLTYLVDKYEFAKILDRTGLPHPQTAFLDGPGDLDALSEAWFQNAFLKPHHSQAFFKHYGVKGFFIRSREEGYEKIREIMDNGFKVLLQQYIPGPPDGHYFIDGFVDRQGRLFTAFARQRLRMYPPDFGNSTYMKSVPLEKAVGALETLQILFPEIRFNGIFSAEFKKDPADGLFKILEINARPWWYVDFATRCGVNVCKLAYDEAVGRALSQVPPYEISAYAFPRWDYFAIRRQEKHIFAGLLLMLRSWLPAKKPVFSWRDPVPALVMFAQRVGRYIRKKTR